MNQKDIDAVTNRINENAEQSKHVKTVDQILNQQSETALLISKIRFLTNQFAILSKIYDTPHNKEDSESTTGSHQHTRDSHIIADRGEQKYIDKENSEKVFDSYQHTRDSHVKVVIENIQKSFPLN